MKRKEFAFWIALVVIAGACMVYGLTPPRDCETVRVVFEAQQGWITLDLDARNVVAVSVTDSVGSEWVPVGWSRVPCGPPPEGQ